MSEISIGRSGRGLIMVITQNIGPDPFNLPKITSVDLSPAQIDDLRKKLDLFEQHPTSNDG